MECVTEPNIFAFGIPPIKVIAPKENTRIELLNVKMFWVAFKLRHLKMPVEEKNILIIY